MEEELKSKEENFQIDKNWNLSYKNTREYAELPDIKEIFQRIKHDYYVHINSEAHWIGSFLRSD